MKRMACFLGAVILIGGGGAYLVAQREAMEPEHVQSLADNASQAIRGSVAGLVGLGKDKPGVLATVNGKSITLAQVEALYDMSSPSLVLRGDSLDSLRYDYSLHIQRLIVQRLVQEELASRRLVVTDDEVQRLEAHLSENFSQLDGDSFDQHIEAEGIQPFMWREQLRARLELERWWAELGKGVLVSAQEVQDYIKTHPAIAAMPEQIHGVLVSGRDQSVVEQSREDILNEGDTAGAVSVAKLRKQGLDVRAIPADISTLPGPWQAALSGLKNGEASPVKFSKESPDRLWRYAFVKERTPAHSLSAVELYARAESLLIAQRLPETFEAWLHTALMNADIRMAETLRPKNAPKPNLEAVSRLLSPSLLSVRPLVNGSESENVNASEGTDEDGV